MNTAALVCSVLCIVGFIATMGWLALQGQAGAIKGDDDA